ITDPLERLARLRGVSFRWCEAPAGDGDAYMASPLPSPQASPEYGVVAQEAEAEFPSLVSLMGAQEHLGVEYSGMADVRNEDVKQLRAENDELRARVTAREESAPG